MRHEIAPALAGKQAARVEGCRSRDVVLGIACGLSPAAQFVIVCACKHLDDAGLRPRKRLCAVHGMMAATGVARCDTCAHLGSRAHDCMILVVPAEGLVETVKTRELLIVSPETAAKPVPVLVSH
jgi:hypothetical protein